MTDSAPATPAPASTLQLLRSFGHLVAVVVITWWATIEWGFPWPGVVVGLAFLLLTVLLWALFLSPRPVLRTDRFGQGLVELLLIAGAAGAMLGLGAPWMLAVAYGIAAALLGYLAGMKRA